MIEYGSIVDRIIVWLLVIAILAGLGVLAIGFDFNKAAKGYLWLLGKL